MAAKRTGDLIPLCHPLPLDAVELAFDFPDETSVAIEAVVRVTAATGVEMEAPTAVEHRRADDLRLCKSIDRAITIEGIRLEEKSGGRSGHFRRAGNPRGTLFSALADQVPQLGKITRSSARVTAWVSRASSARPCAHQPAHGATEHRRRADFGIAQHAKQLAVARQRLGQQLADRFVGLVAVAQARAAGEQYGVDIRSGGKLAEQIAHRPGLVGNDVPGHDPMPSRLQPLA